jgi:hypothetical protein
MLLKPLGRTLMVTGAAVGIAVGVGIGLGISLPGIPCLIAVGLVKLTLLGSGVLMGTGAFLERLSGRKQERDRLPPGPGR